MATGEPPCQSEDQSPQPISQGHALEVVIADEIPRQSGLQKASGLLPQACAQKRKRDWSSGSEEELHEDLLGHTDGVPRQAPYFMPQSPAHRKEKDYAPSELESEAEQEKDHQRESDSALSRKPSLQLRSTGHKWNREWSSNLEEGEEMGRPRYFDLAPREVHCLPPRKRWREYLSLCSEEPQQPLEPLSPVPSTHTGVRAKPCGLKKKMKMKHLSSVLPEHHTAFTRLLGKDNPHCNSNLVVQEHKRLLVTSFSHGKEVSVTTELCIPGGLWCHPAADTQMTDIHILSQTQRSYR
ncbi:hypothetical protein H920_08526 [Fukomys damarensis]|uniref:Uncharacterized protein n=1 Tax=Fukomys damarensis TaxID=885580 RepID=A0A091DHU5_FUKDA|nr:hypothetical protein H920_08526 [Fukomys damarensis]